MAYDAEHLGVDQSINTQKLSDSAVPFQDRWYTAIVIEQREIGRKMDLKYNVGLCLNALASKVHYMKIW